MKLKLWEAILLLLLFWFAFYCGFARADVIEDAQQTVIVINESIKETYNTWQHFLANVIPYEDISVDVTHEEVGITWTF